jgi:photosystem II stability/assembly factor-like uncharacterized protein
MKTSDQLPSLFFRRVGASTVAVLVFVFPSAAQDRITEDALSHAITIESAQPSGGVVHVRIKDGRLQSCGDAIAWTNCLLPVKTFVRAIAFGYGQVVAVGGSYFDAPASIITSRDGVHWTRCRIQTTSPLYGVAFGNDLFVAVGEAGAIFTSPDGANWTRRRSACSGVLLATVTFGNGRFVAGGESGAILTSTNALQWTRSTLCPEIYVGHIAFTNGSFVVRHGVDLFSSVDALKWERCHLASRVE